ncbi:MAG: hypothetical protein K2J50_00415, partial [Treponemataceae bacterium]|nr:hypothetical protein [Treponemataceae bacterium]
GCFQPSTSEAGSSLSQPLTLSQHGLGRLPQDPTLFTERISITGDMPLLFPAYFPRTAECRCLSRRIFFKRQNAAVCPSEILTTGISPLIVPACFLQTAKRRCFARVYFPRTAKRRCLSWWDFDERRKAVP